MPATNYSHSFDYRDHGNGSFPTLDVEIVNPADPTLRVRVDAYLDSGASRSVLSRWIAPAIGLQLLDGAPLAYVNNMGQEYEGRVLPVIISHEDLGDCSVELGFAMWDAPRCLLGRDFFNLLQIGFRERQLEFYVEPTPLSALFMPKTIQQKATFRVSPDVLFELYLNSRKHSAATGAKAMGVTSVAGIWRSFRSA